MTRRYEKEFIEHGVWERDESVITLQIKALNSIENTKIELNYLMENDG